MLENSTNREQRQDQPNIDPISLLIFNASTIQDAVALLKNYANPNIKRNHIFEVKYCETIQWQGFLGQHFRLYDPCYRAHKPQLSADVVFYRVPSSISEILFDLCGDKSVFIPVVYPYEYTTVGPQLKQRLDDQFIEVIGCTAEELLRGEIALRDRALALKEKKDKRFFKIAGAIALTLGFAPLVAFPVRKLLYPADPSPKEPAVVKKGSSDSQNDVNVNQLLKDLKNTKSQPEVDTSSLASMFNYLDRNRTALPDDCSSILIPGFNPPLSLFWPIQAYDDNITLFLESGDPKGAGSQYRYDFKNNNAVAITVWDKNNEGIPIASSRQNMPVDETHALGIVQSIVKAVRPRIAKEELKENVIEKREEAEEQKIERQGDREEATETRKKKERLTLLYKIKALFNAQTNELNIGEYTIDDISPDELAVWKGDAKITFTLWSASGEAKSIEKDDEEDPETQKKVQHPNKNEEAVNKAEEELKQLLARMRSQIESGYNALIRQGPQPYFRKTRRTRSPR